MTGSVQRPAAFRHQTCARPLGAAAFALSDIPPFGGARDVAIALDSRTAFASSHPVVIDVKKGQSGDVYYH